MDELSEFSPTMEGEMKVYGLTTNDAHNISHREQAAAQLPAFQETVRRMGECDDLNNEFSDQIASMILELGDMADDMQRSANRIAADDREFMLEAHLAHADATFEQTGWVL
ncbi:hypothetical protein [Acetobacter sp. UBA5411]|uniref:hypothetical protein n=1 Tax=Acetobacter sp. UBA5411 TaxID=1945905 RepID=UPI0025C123EE|nr:hypothetical protein [Acetobacter sp. UBA5411]